MIRLMEISIQLFVLIIWMKQILLTSYIKYLSSILISTYIFEEFSTLKALSLTIRGIAKICTTRIAAHKSVWSILIVVDVDKAVQKQMKVCNKCFLLLINYICSEFIGHSNVLDVVHANRYR
jgi:hypothetical protein